MNHIILEVTASNGIKSKVRTTQDEPVTDDDIEYHEKYYVDRYTYPDNVSAVVVNIFTTEEE